MHHFNKSIVIDFNRKLSTKDFKYHTHATLKLKSIDNSHHGFKNSGVLHKSLHMLQSSFTGDIPSLSKKIDAIVPLSDKGKAAKGFIKNSYNIVSVANKDFVKSALAAETMGIKSFNSLSNSARNLINRSISNQAYSCGQADTAQSALLFSKTALDATKGSINFYKKSKALKIEKNKLNDLKSQSKLINQKNKLKLSSAKAEFKIKEASYNKHLESYNSISKKDKLADSFSLRQNLIKRRTEIFKNDKNKLSNIRSEIKLDKKSFNKQINLQNKIVNQSKRSLLLMPIKYGSNQIKQSVRQRAMQDDNDFVNMIDKASTYSPKVIKSNERKANINKNALSKAKSKKAKQQNKLQMQQHKLKTQRQLLNTKYRSVKSKAIKKKILKSKKPLDILSDYGKKFLLTCIVPILPILLVLLLMIEIITSLVSSNAGIQLGTYPVEDYDISKAKKYYTELAEDMNDSVIKCGTSNWKSGLSDLGVNTSSMTEKPDTFVFGRSTQFDYDTVYDFDSFKFYSFLCAYYYDFSCSHKDIPYWDYTSATNDLVKKLFTTEYDFQYYYNNQSHWEKRSNFNTYGGGACESTNSKYYLINNDIVSSDSMDYDFYFTPVTDPPDAVKAYEKENKIYIKNHNGCYRIVDPNHNYDLTPFVVPDVRYSCQSVSPFYYYDATRNKYWFGKYTSTTHVYQTHWRTTSTITRSDGTSVPINFAVSDTDTYLYNNTYLARMLVSYSEQYFWQKKCVLYYTVHRKMDFDAAIQKILKEKSHYDERLKYYNILIGNSNDSNEKMYGNHQLFKFPIKYESIIDEIKRGYILNGYGYDMQVWGKQHCAIDDNFHNGIDIVCNSGTNIYSPVKGTVSKIDNDKHIIKIRANRFYFWYENNHGTHRSVEITFGNIRASTLLHVGDEIDAEKYIGKTTTNRQCADLNFNRNNSYDYLHLAIEIDTDGIGWNYVDPILVLY